ncbi:hypothetical protein CO180_01650 [candidate division WWE3 bacterium CG_4_9_14_3_um_filter_41_6]|uniref:Uncharacterized protein n=1 Tax=candidate division WWE3 bacterium CG_4_10_14_0_2_um_filter_41_14 TaxID=1975072 RepID=A0A2M7TEW6_UNCKA|nr:MAG: hypothetical protein COY32_06685 [candidate division WWE3 bacterium CG_4_10_14_0_2_um_filter_41_14]PJA39064.1 MAG: hypothetical protein CO180_01650 [candidate division WWE3 bacterium CG_4_9_14_3_um_filter_41_6]
MSHVPSHTNIPLIKSVSANVSYQLTSRFVTAFASFLVARMIITAYPSLWGEYQTLITFVTVFWLLTDFGLNAVAVNWMSKPDSDTNIIFGSLLTLRTIMGIILMGISFAILTILPYTIELKIAISIGLITLVTQGIRGATNAIFQARLSYKYLFYAELVGTIGFVTMLWWFIQRNPTILEISVVFVIAQILMMTISLFLAHRLVSIRWIFNFSILKPMFIATIPLGISLLFNLGNFKLDALLLSVMKGTGDVGIYNAAYKFFEFALVIPTFFMNSMYPVLVTTFATSRTQFASRMVTSFKILLGVSLSGAVFGFVAAPVLIDLLGGSNADLISDSVMILRILIVIIPLFYVSSLLMWGVMIMGGQNYLIRVYVSAFATNLMLNLIFIPSYGYFAAAITTGISEAVVLVLLGIKLSSLYKKGEFDA